LVAFFIFIVSEALLAVVIWRATAVGQGDPPSISDGLASDPIAVAPSLFTLLVLVELFGGLALDAFFPNPPALRAMWIVERTTLVLSLVFAALVPDIPDTNPLTSAAHDWVAGLLVAFFFIANCLQGCRGWLETGVTVSRKATYRRTMCFSQTLNASLWLAFMLVPVFSGSEAFEYAGAVLMVGSVFFWSVTF